MATAAQSALAEGMRTLTRNVGEWFVFGGRSFPATVSEPLQVASGFPRGKTPGPEYDLEIEASVCDIKTSIPREKQTLRCGGVSYIIAAVRNPPGSHKVVFLVVQPKPK